MTKKERKSKEVSQVEVHDVSSRLSKKQNILIFGILSILVVTSSAWLVVQKVSKPKVVIPKTALKATSIAEVQGLDNSVKESLIASNPDPKKDPAAAQAKALALAANGDFKQSLSLYATIVKQKVPYTYTYNYGLTVAQSGDLKSGITILKQSLEALKSDTSLLPEVKATEIDKLQNKIELLEAEAINE